MRVYLGRHREARSEAEDSERPWTAKGEEETRKISEAAMRLGIRPSKIHPRGKNRAKQTAGIIAGALNGPALMDQGLNPNDDILPPPPVLIWGRDDAFLASVSHRIARTSGLHHALWK